MKKMISMPSPENYHAPHGGRNTAKERRFLTENPREHEQVRITGIRKGTNRTFDIWCDAQIAPLIKQLNEEGIRTLYSFLPNAVGIRNGGYVLFTCPSPKKLAIAVTAIKKFWKGYYILSESDEYVRISFYQYSSKSSIRALAEFKQREGVHEDE